MDCLSTYSEYCRWLTEQPMNNRTKRIYAARVGAFLEFLRQSPDAPALSEDQLDSAVRDFGQHLTVTQLARPTTVNSYYTVIAHFCRYLQWDCSSIKLSRIKGGATRIKFLTDIEVQRYADAIDRCAMVRDRVLARLILFGGLRLGECVALNVDSLDGSVSPALKLSVGELTMTLDGTTSKLMNTWLHQRLEFSDGTEPALFLTRNGNRLSAKGVDFVLRRIGISCGLVVCARMLRNTCLRQTQPQEHDSTLCFEPFFIDPIRHARLFSKAIETQTEVAAAAHLNVISESVMQSQ